MPRRHATCGTQLLQRSLKTRRLFFKLTASAPARPASPPIGYNAPMIFLVCFFLLLLPAAAKAQEQRAAASSPLTRAEIEEFLLKASIVSERQYNNYQWRISLEDGKRRHDAAANAEAGTTPSERNHRLNVAAYELDKLLELNFVPPSVERTFNGQPASVTWWVDNVAMMEIDRRRKRIEPPDPDSWNQQMQVVRVFDELISNPYRAISPDDKHYMSWDCLLITRDWRFWLIDHTQAFRVSKQLEHPQSLIQCDRALLGKLRQLNKEVLKQRLAKYLSPKQLEALEARRQLLVKHFDQQIARKGEGAVLYDLPPRP